MEKNKTRTKKLMIAFLLIAFTSCNYRRNMTVFQINGTGLNQSSVSIDVDSVTTTTPHSAEIWIDGRKTIVYADKILIGN